MRSGRLSQRKRNTVIAPIRLMSIRGSALDHIAFDPEHRLVLSVVVGKRTAENVQAVVKDFYTRTEGRLMCLITTDEYSCYETAILEAYGQTVVPERTGRPGRPKAPYKIAPEELCYATVRKTRKKGRVEEIIVRAVFGSLEMIEAALKHSRVSRAVNTAFIERYNGTDRNFNARKVRKTYCFSKDWQVHEALTYFSMYSLQLLLGGEDAWEAGWEEPQEAREDTSDGSGVG
jgi:IS1 family transposase